MCKSEKYYVDNIVTSYPISEKAIRNKGVTQQVLSDNYVVYSLSKAKTCAACSTTVTNAIVSIVKEWNLPEGSKCEAFINKLRIPRGDIYGVSDLPNGLSDAVCLNPLFFDVKCWRNCRDVYVAQYQGKGDFFAWQWMGAHHATHHIQFNECRNVYHHGKWNSDESTHVIWSNIKKILGHKYG